jgi:hypothetical protein
MQNLRFAPPDSLASAIAAEKNTAFAEVDQAFDRAHALAERAISLANRLAGTVPEQSAAGSDAKSPDGILPTLYEQALATQRMLARGHNAIDRIERALP